MLVRRVSSSVRLQFAFLRYHEALAVLFAYVGGLDQPAVCWRFDVVSRRPPQVSHVGHRGIHERDHREDSDTSVPAPVAVLFDALKHEIVR